jgi:ABC-type polysaccharide/polyol phosphate export permease
VALLLASANVFFNDVSYLWNIAVQLMFYSTPIIWDPDMVVGNEWLTRLASWGPTGGFVVAIHQVMYDMRMPSALRFGQMIGYAVLSFALGAWVFNRLSPRFAEEL